jgi:hypothetical protein
VQVDLCGSTGGIALAYDPAMRNTIIPLSLLVFFLACGDDGEPTRPADGTVKAWESCVWDGSKRLNSARPTCRAAPTASARRSVRTFEDCPKFDGFEVECGQGDRGRHLHAQVQRGRRVPEDGRRRAPVHQFYCIGRFIECF